MNLAVLSLDTVFCELDNFIASFLGDVDDFNVRDFAAGAAPQGPALVIGYARLAPGQLEEAIRVLASVIAS